MSAVPVASQPAVGPIDGLPKDLISAILGVLPPLERSASGCVSRLWNIAVREPLLWPPSLDAFNSRVIDELVWRKHALHLIKMVSLTFEGTRPIERNDIVAIMKVTKFYARLQAAGLQIEGNKGVTILTIPKGLTIDLVRTMFRDRIEEITLEVKANLGPITIHEAYQVIITNNVLEGIQRKDENTRDMSVEKQMAVVAKVGCVLPKVLEAMILVLFTEMSTRQRLFFDDPLTYTRCLDVTDKPTVVGGFTLRGFDVMFCRFIHRSRGAAAVVKF